MLCGIFTVNLMAMFSVHKFQTEVLLPDVSGKVGYRSPFLMMGSCFASNIGAKLIRLKLPVLVNPFGVIYNPFSIAKSVKMMVMQDQLSQGDLFLQNGVWNSYSHHSSFSRMGAEECLENINHSILSGSTILRDSSHVVVTLGTSWAYKLKENGDIVANCHKTSAKEFERIFISASETVDCLANMIHQVREVNPSVNFMLTVSPIRHLKDGLVENQRSKSSLIVACHELCRRFNFVSYFPSYEIMMDELRDYRFYDEDMVHPSALATDIIFNKFVEAAFDADSKKAMADIDKLLKSKEHRPVNPNTQAHYLFKKRMLEKVEELQMNYPFLDLTEEFDYFER